MLLVDANPQGMSILAQIFSGFGVNCPLRSETPDEARAILCKTPVDLVVIDSSLPDEDGYAFVHWLRRTVHQPNTMTPAIVTAGHTPMRDILRARDCGANYVVAKPLRPKILLDRIQWVGASSRGFVETATYCGPDRRWRSVGPPAGTRGRRATDLSTEVGAATQPNLDQSDIASFFKPNKVSI